jgi:hypothetical protein
MMDERTSEKTFQSNEASSKPLGGDLSVLLKLLTLAFSLLGCSRFGAEILNSNFSFPLLEARAKPTEGVAANNRALLCQLRARPGARLQHRLQPEKTT